MTIKENDINVGPRLNVEPSFSYLRFDNNRQNYVHHIYMSLEAKPIATTTGTA